MTDEHAALLRESIALNGNCCGDSAWRGRPCEYHRGFRDALDVIEGRVAVDDDHDDEHWPRWLRREPDGFRIVDRD